MNYLIIFSGEDGLSIEAVTKEKLLDRITPDEFGCTYYGNDVNILDYLPKVIDQSFDNEPFNSMVIIKGDIVVPKVVEKILRYEL